MTRKRQLSRVTLYFVLRRDKMPAVSEIEWTRFLNREVTPFFPVGLTVTHGRGQYKAGSGLPYDEATKVLEIICERTPEADQRIEAIRTLFKLRFEQKTVLRVDSMAVGSP